MYFTMPSNDATEMDVPDGWTVVEEASTDATYELDDGDRTLRALLRKRDGEFKTEILDATSETQGRDHKKYPETFDSLTEAVENLRMHMEYYV